MGIQVIFFSLFLVAPLSQAATRPCFNFSKKITKPLVVLSELGSENVVFGKLPTSVDPVGPPDGTTWSRVIGVVEKPLDRVLNLLLDHNTTKSPKVDEMAVEVAQNPDYIAQHFVDFTIKPFLFITVKWREQWGYELLTGTLTQPQEVLISYEKVSGTTHIEHLCGSVVLRKLDSNRTEVLQYERAKATSRSPEDTRDGLIGTLDTLRKI